MPARSSRSAIGLVAWWAVSITVGAWLAHGLFNGAMALAEITTHKSINAPVDLLARWCRNNTFSDFHRDSILIVAGLGAWLFARHFRDPASGLRTELGLLRRDWKSSLTALVSLLVCVLFTIAITSVSGGWYAWDFPSSWARLLALSFLSAVLIELTFRGVFQRVFSATMPPGACGLLAGLCYVLAMLALAPPGIGAWEPEISSERFPLTRAMTSGWIDSMVFFKYIVPLCLLAVCLGFGRLRTGSLWLVIGTQTGFLFSSGISTSPIPAAVAAVLAITVFCGLPFTRPQRES